MSDKNRKQSVKWSLPFVQTKKKIEQNQKALWA